MASMMGIKAAGLLVLLGMSNSGSCRGQSSGPDAANKEPEKVVADVNVPGIDTSALTPREKREWSASMNDFLAPCKDVPVSLAQCIQENRPCTKCMTAARYLLKGVRDGYSRDQIEKSYKNRFAAENVREVPIEGSPTMGPDSASTTLVEFADFECPHCKLMAPEIDKLVNDKHGQVRFAYKFLPLPGHAHGEISARAAYAAWQQGKFWEMHHKLFENQKALEEQNLLDYAKDLGLDVAKFKIDMASPGAKERIEKDKKLADALAVKGTPTIFVNGREWSGPGGLGDFVEMEMGEPAPGAPKGTASAAPSGAPTASASPSSQPPKAGASANAKTAGTGK
ncbi:MAG: thioredoxin domain-containing protein [Polyangiaceae bacterium]